MLKWAYSFQALACLSSVSNFFSEFRQIPDNQEVFLNPSNDQSITIDILEAVSAPSLHEAVK